MAGGKIHAQDREFNRPENKRKEFRGKKLESAVLKIKGSGMQFTGLVPENANVNERIERIVKQNGGEIKKQYYREMDAYEIIEIRVGDQFITKNEEAGIHWGIEGDKIPIAVDEGCIKGFLNGEEIKSKEISIWSEASTADPKSIEELHGNKRNVAGAHVAEREKDPDLKKNQIILFDKETGELSPVQKTREAESFDYGEISMEKIFIFEISAVQNKSIPVFENKKGMGEMFYSYIEIIDAKESITDRITIANRAVEIPMPAAIGTAQQTIDIQPANENIELPVLEIPTAPLNVDYSGETPKPKYTQLPLPDYFQNKPIIKAAEESKIKIPETAKSSIKTKIKLFRYPPKIEKIKNMEVKRIGGYVVPAHVFEISGKEIRVHKIENKPRVKEKGIPKKRITKRRKRKRKKVIELAEKTHVKIKKIKAKIRELVKDRKKKQKESFKKPKTNAPKKKMKPKLKVKKGKNRKKAKTHMKAKKEKLLKRKSAGKKKALEEKRKRKKLSEKPGKEIKQERNKRNNHKRLHQMLV